METSGLMGFDQLETDMPAAFRSNQVYVLY